MFPTEGPSNMESAVPKDQLCQSSLQVVSPCSEVPGRACPEGRRGKESEESPRMGSLCRSFSQHIPDGVKEDYHKS